MDIPSTKSVWSDMKLPQKNASVGGPWVTYCIHNAIPIPNARYMGFKVTERTSIVQSSDSFCTFQAKSVTKM